MLPIQTLRAAMIAAVLLLMGVSTALAEDTIQAGTARCVAAFLAACTRDDVEARPLCKKVYSAYKKFCKRSGVGYSSPKSFGRRLRTLRPGVRRTQDKVHRGVYTGFELINAINA